MDIKAIDPAPIPLKSSRRAVLEKKIRGFLQKRFVFWKYSFPAGFLVAVAGVVAVIFVAVTWYLLVVFRGGSGDQSAATQKEIILLTGQIEKFMDLPENEEPTLATVSDREKLEGQLFFAKSQNGDKVLVYSKSKKAILYRPSEKRIIEFATLSSSDGQNGCPPAPSQPEIQP